MILYYLKIALCIILSSTVVILVWQEFEDVMAGVEDWPQICQWTCAIVILLAFIILVSAYSSKQYLVGGLAVLTMMIGSSYFILEKYYLLPENYYEYKKLSWARSGYSSYALSSEVRTAFLSNKKCRALFSSKEVRELLIQRLRPDEESYYLIRDSPINYALFGILVYESFRQTNENKLAQILFYPNGHRVISALLYNEFNIDYADSYRGQGKEEMVMLKEFNLKPSSTFQFGLLNTEDFRTYYNFCVENIDKLALTELELLLFYHSKVPIKVPKEDFRKLVARLTELKPYYKNELQQTLDFKEALEDLFPNVKEGDKVFVKVEKSKQHYYGVPQYLDSFYN